MNWIRNTVVGLAAILLSVPLAYGQDLSKYRNFSLGTNLVGISKQMNKTSVDAVVIHPSPALIQEMAYWPYRSYQSSVQADPVEEIVFSFYNGELYKMAITYQGSATQGMTPADMVRAISAEYGDAMMAAAAANLPDVGIYDSIGAPIATWGDAQYLITLARSPLSNAFQLVFVSKQLSGQADAVIAEASRQAREDAPQKETARAKKEVDDLEARRQTNLKAFRP